MCSYPAIIQINGTFLPDFNINNYKTSTVQTQQVIADVITSQTQTTASSSLDYLSVASGASLPKNSTLAISPLVTDSSTTVATTAFVKSAIDKVLGSTNLNTTLDTIYEIQTALGNDPNFSGTILTRLSNDETNINLLQSDLDTANTNITNNTNSIDTINSDLTTLQSRVTTNEYNITNNTNSINTINATLLTKANKVDLTTLQDKVIIDESTISSQGTRINNLENKTNAVNYDTATNTTTINSKLKVNIDDQLNGNTIIGDQLTDTLTVNAITTFNNTVNGINKNMVGLGNVDNTSDINKPISTSTQNAINLKANLTGALLNQPLTRTLQIFPSGFDWANVSGSAYSAITNNTTGGHAELNFINTYYNNSAQPSYLAFMFSKMANNTDNAARNDLVKIYNNGDTSIIGKLTTSDIITTGTNPITSLNTKIYNLENKTNAVNYDTATNTTTINSKLKVNVDDQLNGNTIIGDQLTDTLKVNAITTFNNTVNGITKNMVGLGNVDNISDVDKPISTSTQTALDLKANISDVYTKSQVDQIKSDIYGGVPSTTLDTIAEIATQLQTDTNSIGTILTTVGTKANTTDLGSYYTKTQIDTNYATKNNTTLTGQTSINEVVEQVYNAGSGSSLSLTYTSIKGIVLFNPSINFTLSLSSVPTTSTTATYTITLIMPAKYYANAITINGTSYTMISSNGLANISINASSTYVLQQINIMFLNSSIPTIMTNVLSMF